MTFNLNNHNSQDNSGSPAERFFLRGICSSLPNSFERNLKASDLMKIRSDKRQKLASKKGRTSKDEFYAGQTVRIQDVISKNWFKKGTIEESRKADDYQETSFIIRLLNGRLTTRHRCHIKPDVTRNTKIS